MNESTPEITPLSQLAETLSEAFNKLVDYRLGQLDGDIETIREDMSNEVTEQWLARVKNAPADKITWFMLTKLVSAGHAEVAEQLWDKLMARAVLELERGDTAFAVVKGITDTPALRAKFLALRNGLRQELSPRGTLESMMLDQIAQSMTLHSYWLEAHSSYIGSSGWNNRDQLPRMEDADAALHSLSYADKFSKMGLRHIRALRDLRRMAPPVVVQNAGQVNVGNQQVNVTQ